MNAGILWVEGKRAEGLPFVLGLRKKGYTVETAGSGDEALGILRRMDPDLVVVNAASLRTSGKRICREVRKHAAGVPIVLITEQPDPAAAFPKVNLVVPAPYTPSRLAQQVRSLFNGENARLLWIKSRSVENITALGDLRRRSYIVEPVNDRDDMAERLSTFNPNLVVLDAVALGAAAKTVYRKLRQHAPEIPVALIIEPDTLSPTDVPADVILTLPFTPRKLLNRIKPLLPGDGSHLLHTGPIRLDTDLKRVHCQGREHTLTPRLVQLLKIFMDQPGVALERGTLFREVWKTEYTGDTRTLDVHISWLRQAIEEDPRNPRFIKTIRGLGYRLDV